MVNDSRRQFTALVLALLVVLSGLGGAGRSARRVQDSLYDVKIDAAQRMEACMERIRSYKAGLGIPLSEEDLHSTGMIGDAFSPITTTIGALEAKRTTANPDMAAMVVDMFRACGLQAGDTVGAGFSGSFPALDIAVLCACEAMDLECVYIASVGASTYGANQVELTLPDMLCRLADEGLVPFPAAVTLGGADDVGLDMDPDAAAAITARLEDLGFPPFQYPDFIQNIRWRMDLYQQKGPIDCFVGVGGNLTTSGVGIVRTEQGILRPDDIQTLNDRSGLLDRYCAEGIPVIHLLNVKELAAEYGLAYDPETLPPMGESAIYYQTGYSVLPTLISLPLAALILYWGFKRKKPGPH